jgi:hypothetical protein
MLGIMSSRHAMDDEPQRGAKLALVAQGALIPGRFGGVRDRL